MAEMSESFMKLTKKLNEDRPILSVAKCMPMTLISRNIKHMQISAGVPRGEEASIVSVHAGLRCLEHEHTFITYL